MQINLKLFVVQSIGFLVILALVLFLPAGTLTWSAGWIYLALFLGFYLGVNAWLFRHDPDLLQERLSLRKPDQKGWDKVIFPLFLLFPFVWLAFISFDAARFHWSPVSLGLQAVGALILLCSFYLFFLTFRENSYLSTVVRIQAERGHRVVSTGPYHYVRHPMYAAFLPFMIGTPLLLGSWYGVLFGLVFVIVLAQRAVLEERTLQKELPGYDLYMRQVKYRLIPYIW
ncbi:MAG TPA: isoprenylcysteine carboxylmethyltransferase family protein [Anaerolineales bacterium]|nr:isoprenylcysteine carboxylmethyltransferase family protein [Anaerolineales bacterium]